MGFITSFIYKQTTIRNYTNLESTLLFLFTYCCFAMAESFELSGVMALFFNGIVLSHYNSYNLSDKSRYASEQIFSTLATVSETIVFLYMGMGVFTSDTFNLSKNIYFSIFAMILCILGRLFNIIPLSLLANTCRDGKEHISCNMQIVLWFAGLRGAIAYALAENMPGEQKDTYVTGTLTICIITTIICGGFTEKVLTVMDMKETNRMVPNEFDIDGDSDGTIYENNYMRDSVKNFILHLDRNYLREVFGGEVKTRRSPTKARLDRSIGDYELGRLHDETEEFGLA